MVINERRDAIHEACHAVVGLLVGEWVYAVSLDPPRTTFAEWMDGTRPAILRRLAAGAAPCAAQVVFGMDDGLEHDMQMTRTLELFLHPVERERYVRPFLAGLQELVRRHEDAIERVASELLVRRKLTGQQLRELVVARSRP